MLTIHICSFVYGALLNIYDDIIDTKLIVSSSTIEYIKLSTTTLFSILFFYDGVFCFIHFELTILSLMMDSFYTSKLDANKETEFQKDLCVMNDCIYTFACFLSGIMLPLHTIHNWMYLMNTDFLDVRNLTLYANILIAGLLISIDGFCTPEHVSDKKLYLRCLLLFFFCTLIWGTLKYSFYVYSGCYSIGFMYIGILSSSVGFLGLEKFELLNNYKRKIK